MNMSITKMDKQLVDGLNTIQEERHHEGESPAVFLKTIPLCDEKFS